VILLSVVDCSEMFKIEIIFVLDGTDLSLL